MPVTFLEHSFSDKIAIYFFWIIWNYKTGTLKWITYTNFALLDVSGAAWFGQEMSWKAYSGKTIVDYFKAIQTWHYQEWSYKFLFSDFHFLLPNGTKYTNTFDKKIPQNKIERVFMGRNTGLQGWKWIAIDIWMSRNQSCHSGEIWNLLLLFMQTYKVLLFKLSTADAILFYAWVI